MFCFGLLCIVSGVSGLGVCVCVGGRGGWVGAHGHPILRIDMVELFTLAKLKKTI